MAVQPDGKIVVIGTVGSVGYDIAVVRLEGDEPTAIGTEGDDNFAISPGTQAGTLKLNVNGVITDNLPSSATMRVEGRGGNDAFTVTAAPTASLILDGADGSDIYDISFGNLAGNVVVADKGAPGSDQLVARGTAGNDYLFKDDWRVSLGDPVQQTILYSGIEALTIHGGSGDDTIMDPGNNTHIFGDAGNDTVIITATSGNGVTVDGGAGSDTYLVGGDNLAGPVTVADTGSSGSDRISIIGTPGDDTVVQTTSGFTLNGTNILVTAVETAAVDGGGEAGDTFTVVGSPSIPAAVQGVSDTTINGTGGNDTIVLTPLGNSGQVNVKLNGKLLGTYSSGGRLSIHGQAGDDDIQVAGAVSIPLWLYGDAGNDRLKGGDGVNVLMGGAGDDLLVGGSERDILIGGTGADRIVGNEADDILIAGSTAFDANDVALLAILQSWTCTDRTYQQRCDDLKTVGIGDNGSIRLNAETVFDDGVQDLLTGSAGQDWFFANLAGSGVKDKVTDLSAAEFAIDLDWILWP